MALAAGSFAAAGFAVGQLVWVSGVNNGPRTIASISADGKTLTLSGGPIPTASVANGTVALVRIGGDNITLTGPSFNGNVSTTAGSITRTGGSFIADGFAIGQQVILGGGLSGVFTITNVTATTLGLSGGTVSAFTGSATATVLPVGAGPGQPFDNFAPLVIYGDTSQDGVWYGGDPHTQSLHNFGPKPMPHDEGAVVTLTSSGGGLTGTITLVSPGSGSGSFLTDGFAVGQELALGPTTIAAQSAPGTVYDIGTNTLTRATGSWVADGFVKGQQVTIAGLPGTWNVVDVNAAVLTLNGPQLSPFPNANFVVTAVSQYVGVVKAVTKTTIVLNLALTLADFPNGPNFVPAAGNVTRDIRVLNRVGNSAPFFVFPLANPYLYSGNDVIDAHLLDWSDPVGALRPIGLTIYGGPGNDLIIGSQTGDQLAGGSGDDAIMGERGKDFIYGDSGFNVNLLTRGLTVAVVGTGPAGYSAAKFTDKDNLIAGQDLLYGEGPGSEPSATADTNGNYDDVIFGDHGLVTQDVAGPRDVTKPVPGLPQDLQTTLRSRVITSLQVDNGANDTIYGNVGEDVLIGGTGDDAIDGGTGRDLIFGDHVSLDRTTHLGNFTDPRFEDLSGTQLYSTDVATAGNVLVDGNAQLDPRGRASWGDYLITIVGSSYGAQLHYYGNDYIAGGPGDDTIFGELGTDTLQGDSSIDYISTGTGAGCATGGHPGAASDIQRVGACRDATNLLLVNPSVDRLATDGHDYIEGGGNGPAGGLFGPGQSGLDVIFGNQGQDDIVGGNSDLYGLGGTCVVANEGVGGSCKRPDGSDLIFGGSGVDEATGADRLSAASLTNAGGDQTPEGHAERLRCDRRGQRRHLPHRRRERSCLCAARLLELLLRQLCGRREDRRPRRAPDRLHAGRRLVQPGGRE